MTTFLKVCHSLHPSEVPVFFLTAPVYFMWCSMERELELGNNCLRIFEFYSFYSEV